MKTLTVTALLLTAAAARARDAALTFGDGNFILDYSRTLFNNAPLGDLQPGEFFSGGRPYAPLARDGRYERNYAACRCRNTSN
jgi:hypothetical protein